MAMNGIRLSGLLWVAAGGALGASLRWGAGLAAELGSLDWSWLWLVNGLGAGLMTLLAAWLDNPRRPVALFWQVGVLGGFTTFSLFSVEVVRISADSFSLALVYALCSVLVWLAAAECGRRLGQNLRQRRDNG